MSRTQLSREVLRLDSSFQHARHRHGRRRSIRLGDKYLSRTQALALLALFGLGLAMWWALIMGAVSVVRHVSGS